MLAGASLREVIFTALLVFLVLAAPLAPRVGSAVGALFAKNPRK